MSAPGTPSTAKHGSEVAVGVKKDFARARKKQKTAYSTVEKHVDALIDQLLEFKASLERAGTDEEARRGVAARFRDEVKRADHHGRVSAAAKDLYTSQAKLGKTIDKTFRDNLAAAYRANVFHDEALNKIIAQHLLRQGEFGVADVFAKESGVAIDDSVRRPFIDMYHVLEALRAGRVEPALAWVDTHREHLTEKQSLLEFELHKMVFVERLRGGTVREALMYARAHLASFARAHPQCMKDLQQLMGCVVYASRLETSPYAALLCESRVERLQDMFVSQCCMLLGYAFESPLHVCVKAGYLALPTLLKIAQVMKAQGTDMLATDVLPSEIELGAGFHYHSIFACPVSRQQSTPDNPPVILPCNHVLSRESMQGIARNSRFKCPYCPSEQTTSQCKEIKFY